ncbi:MAG: uroporphyrinogen-III synthase [Elusimicrobia bacterium]|nr:uroporphyrinogen-III synthase [Elusimicrobiota bacterium]
MKTPLAQPLRRKPGPLSGRTVIITRPESQSRELASRLKKAGAHVILTPLIRTIPPASMKGLDQAIREVAGYDSVVFTSANAVRALFSRARGLGCFPLPEPGRLFAVGEATAKELKAAGWKGGRVPTSNRAEGLARIMGRAAGQRVLFPRAREGRETLPRLLRGAGAVVSVVEAYRTVPDPAGRAALRRASVRGADAVVFASPSAVKVFTATINASRRKRLFSTCLAASIGPITTAALRAAGIKPIIEAPAAGAAGLARLLILHLKGGRA